MPRRRLEIKTTDCPEDHGVDSSEFPFLKKKYEEA